MGLKSPLVFAAQLKSVFYIPSCSYSKMMVRQMSAASSTPPPSPRSSVTQQAPPPPPPQSSSSVPPSPSSSSSSYVYEFERQNSACAWNPQLENICVDPPKAKPVRLMPIFWVTWVACLVFPTYFSIRENAKYYAKVRMGGGWEGKGEGNGKLAKGGLFFVFNNLTFTRYGVFP